MSSGAALADDLDVRIVVDSTVRQTERDSLKLRQAAMQQLIQSLPDNATGSLWSYGQSTRRLAKHGPTSGMWKQVATIHTEHLAPQGRFADLLGALARVLWDLEQADRGPVQVVLISNGHVAMADSSLTDASLATMKNRFAPSLKRHRVTVHTLAVTPAIDGDNIELMRQLSDATGGVHLAVGSLDEVHNAVVDLARLLRAQPEAIVDGRGRFQIAPGTERLTVMWRAEDETPYLIRPDGGRLSRDNHIENGRWVVGNSFEMATLDSPAPGWWQATSVTPTALGVISDLNIVVEGLESPVVPSDESAARVILLNAGNVIESSGFLDLLDVRAYLVDNGVRQPLPVDRDGDGYNAYFVHLKDGAFEFEVEVVGPTFSQKRVVPFHAQNPLRIDVRADAAGNVSAWLSFSHGEVDYSTLKAVAKVRKPPQLGLMVPGQKMPNGLWEIPISEREGILEITYSLSGNYLNKKGFFVKTKPVALTLPLSEDGEQHFFSADGARLNREAYAAIAGESENLIGFDDTGPAQVSSQPETGAAASGNNPGGDAAVSTLEPESPVLSLPLWFVAAISLVSLLLGGIIWWLFRPKPLADLDVILPDTEPEPA